MSTYTKDFSAETTGNAPGDFTDRWDTNWTNTVETSTLSYGDKELQLNPSTTDARRLYSWDDVDGDANRDDLEVLVRFKTSANIGNNNVLQIKGRASGSTSSESAYWFGFNSTTILLAKYVSGTYTQIGSSVTSPVPVSAMDNRWTWARFRVNGSDLKGKVWQVDENEPSGWDIEETDTAITAAGWIGVGTYDDLGSAHMKVDYIAVGTNGDSPSLPIDTSGEPQVNQQYLSVAEQTTSSPEAQVNQQYIQVAEQTTSNPEVQVNQQYIQVAIGNPLVQVNFNMQRLHAAVDSPVSGEVRYNMQRLHAAVDSPVSGEVRYNMQRLHVALDNTPAPEGADYAVVCVNN